MVKSTPVDAHTLRLIAQALLLPPEHVMRKIAYDRVIQLLTKV